MYTKDNKKGDACTLRFVELQVSIALSKSGKKSKQQLFDWLLDRYVNGLPAIIAEISETIKPDGNGFYPPPKQWSAPVEKPVIQSPYQSYTAELQDAKTLDQIQLTMKEVNADKELSNIEKTNLGFLAKKIGSELYND